MTTANDMIQRAMRLTGNLGVGETLEPSEAQDGLAALNTMLDSWSTDSLFVYVLTKDVIPLIPSQATYTIGPTGATVTDRPVQPDNATYVEIGGVSYPIVLIQTAQYSDVWLKSLQSPIPEALWYNPTYPNGTITLFPTPSTTGNLNFWSTKLLQQFPSLTTDIALPPGYKRAIELSLAEEIAPEFETEPSATLVRKAAAARKAIRRVNHRPQFLEFPAEVLSGRGQFNIYSGMSQ